VDCLGHVVHVYVHIEQLGQVEVDFVIVETEQLVTCSDKATD